MKYRIYFKFNQLNGSNGFKKHQYILYLDAIPREGDYVKIKFHTNLSDPKSEIEQSRLVKKVEHDTIENKIIVYL